MNEPSSLNKKTSVTSLSESELQRRDRLRDELLVEFSRFQRRRRRNRLVAISLPLILCVFTLGAFFWRGRWEPMRIGDVAVTNQLPVPPAAEQRVPPVNLETIAAASKSRFGFELEVIDDDELLNMLSDLGQPVALARIDGHRVLIPLKQ